MTIDEHAWHLVRIGDRGIGELETAIRTALAPALGDNVQIQITKIVRTEDAVTALEVEIVLDEEGRDTAFAYG